MTPATWLAQAGTEPELFLPRAEAHPAGAVVGGVSLLLGLAAHRWDFAGRDLLGWVALAGLMVGMWLQWRYKRRDAGWCIQFDQRRVQPVGVRGTAETLAGSGWSIQVAPGERRAGVAIDLRHDDRGRVARLLDSPARGKADLQRIDQLASLLARRLNIPRTGLRL